MAKETKVPKGYKVLGFENHEAINFKKPGDSFIGTYISSKENIGKYEQALHTFENTDGECVVIWGCAGLDRHFIPTETKKGNTTPDVKSGESVYIEYQGKVKIKGRKQQAHQFLVAKEE